MKKRITIPSKVAFTLMALLLLFVLSACGDKAQAPSSGSATAGNQAQAQVGEKLYQLGETAKTDQLEITVTQVEKAANWTKTPAEGYEYVVISIMARNISNEEQSITASQFGFVKDETGNRGSYETYTGVETAHDYSATVAPGENAEISLVFAIPIEMIRIEFHYTVGYSLNPALRFELSR